MLWGLSTGGWMSALYGGAADPERAQVEVVADHGLQSCEWHGRKLMQAGAARCSELADLLEERCVFPVLGVGFNYFTDDADEIARGTDAALEAIETLVPLFRAPLCMTGLGARHRFERDPSLEQQWDTLSALLPPLAQAAHAAGAPLAIHNSNRAHYASDYAELCRRVPHLGMLWDTANPFLMGEKPEDAARDIAPYTFGCHFKDHYADPGCQAVTTRTLGAPLGRGDVPLREIHETILGGAPDPDALVMLFEIDPIEGMTQGEALTEAIQFMRTL